MISSQDEFIDYIKRTLGEPLIRVNVDDEQINDRIDDALEFYRMYHYDATERVIVRKEIAQEMIDNGAVPTVELTQGVNHVWYSPYSSMIGGWHNIFTREIWDKVRDSSNGISSYIKAEADIEEFNSLFKQKINWQFNRHANRILIQIDWSKVQVGDFVVYEATRALDPEDNPDIWNDWWFKRYCTALVKQQWGRNLSKFQNVELPGGMTIDGDSLLSEGMDEQRQMEEEVQSKFAFYGQIYLG